MVVTNEKKGFFCKSQSKKFGRITRQGFAAVLVFLVIFSSMGLLGFVSGQSLASVTVNSGKVVGTNRLSLGFQLTGEWTTWVERSAMEQLTESANFKLIRVFGWHVQPCTKWSETTKTGTFVWTKVDLLIREIFDAGAVPLICLGDTRYPDIKYSIPSGMSLDPSTSLPYPSSWAAYCREWVKHFKNQNLPVRYYETMNEPWLYWGWADYSKMAKFMTVFNAAASAMRAENSAVLISFDGTNRKPVLDYWLSHGGANLDFISLHKYDEGTIGQYSEETLLTRAETYQLITTSSYYGIQDAAKKYYDARGKWIKVINSESNLNSYCDTGSDPIIQKMAGSVWQALMLRTEILNGLDYSIYFNFASSAKWEKTKATGGLGMGMVNIDDNKPWYPYYVYKFIGSNLAVGDRIVESTASSTDLRSIAWIHGNTLNTMVICKNNNAQGLGFNVYGLQGVMGYSKIDNAVSYLYPRVQTGTVDSTTRLTINGYTVILFTSSVPSVPTPTPTPTPALFNDGFESGSLSAWSGKLGTISTSSTTPPGAHHGNYYCTGSIKNAGDGSRIVKKLQTTYSALYVRMYVRMEDLFTGGWQGLGPRFSNADNSAAIGYVMVDCTRNKWGYKVLNTGLTSYFEPSSSMTIQADKWYCVEFYMSIGRSGTCTLWVDGVKKLTGTYDNDAYGKIGYISAQAYGGTTMTASRKWYGDCLVCSTNYIGLEA